ncbi:helix-turn-helix transcriptional regulator [Mycobacterium sp. Aquia_216]|uniref:helix-turn-helix transcriptional regulator n=1 Tax=Mycobacterium sp. Aquia_216 TaxID=2991729 RepID=UPI00227CC43C|nr:helix-turn-helix transcriptional regulator [Mycobacterium sp. Aquia_216]WAJ44868.1 helix-turn-helix transcriptional regulator [Mycobacterium sp. Aquia_216]
MTEESALAQFLRARRSIVQPADVGLPAGGRRRVAGLRREEVAILANISTDYYLRLEQGREEHPSDQVLNAISRALRLDDDAVAYMRNLMRHQSADVVERLQEPHPGIRGLINGWPLAAAHVVDPGLTVVVANELASALSPSFAVGANTMRELFLDQDLPNFYRNWKKLTVWAVALIRVLYGQRPDPALIRLVDELIEQSPRFRHLWERHEVKYEPAGVMLVNHPLVGKLNLNYQQMVLPATGRVLVTYWAEPGSPSEAGMRRLGAT